MKLKIPKEYKKSLPYIISALLLITLSCNFVFDDLLIETLNRIIPLIIISTIILSIPLKNIREAFYYSVIGVIIIEINDNEEDDDVLKNLYKKNKKVKDYSPMEAQLATYKMIDNIKELDTLMNKLTPTLKIGHNLMKNFEKFGFTIKK
jgi:hypothetical protein